MPRKQCQKFEDYNINMIVRMVHKFACEETTTINAIPTPYAQYISPNLQESWKVKSNAKLDS